MNGRSYGAGNGRALVDYLGLEQAVLIGFLLICIVAMHAFETCVKEEKRRGEERRGVKYGHEVLLVCFLAMHAFETCVKRREEG